MHVTLRDETPDGGPRSSGDSVTQRDLASPADTRPSKSPLVFTARCWGDPSSRPQCSVLGVLLWGRGPLLLWGEPPGRDVPPDSHAFAWGEAGAAFTGSAASAVSQPMCWEALLRPHHMPGPLRRDRQPLHVTPAVAVWNPHQGRKVG